MRIGRNQCDSRETETLFKIYKLLQFGLSLDDLGVPMEDRSKIIDGIMSIIIGKQEKRNIKGKMDSLKNMVF